MLFQEAKVTFVVSVFLDFFFISNFGLMSDLYSCEFLAMCDIIHERFILCYTSNYGSNCKLLLKFVFYVVLSLFECSVRV